MRRWRFLFILMTCILIWMNEWSKINCNYQIHLRTAHQNWDEIPLNNRIDLKRQDEKNVPYSFFHTHSDFEWMYLPQMSFWTNLKWIIPVFFTLCFALLEWFMLPLCFESLEIKRPWIVYYYAGLLSLVFLLFFISQVVHADAIFVVARKVWMILQSPSLFVLFFIYNVFKNDQDSEGGRAISR